MSATSTSTRKSENGMGSGVAFVSVLVLGILPAVAGVFYALSQV